MFQCLVLNTSVHVIDWFIVGLVTAVILATLIPCQGEGAVIFGFVTSAAIALLFFLHGAKLSREAIADGIGNWRLHLTVLFSSFVMFPLIGLALRAGLSHWVSAPMLDGLLFLCLLPSTVQSSIAFTSIAHGNVPAAICSASASNVLGMFVTPVLVGLLLASELGQNGAGGGISVEAVGGILLQLLAPFILGHLSRPLSEAWPGRHKCCEPVVNLVDRGSILLVVYTAFSAAIVEGLWHSGCLLGDLDRSSLLLGRGRGCFSPCSPPQSAPAAWASTAPTRSRSSSAARRRASPPARRWRASCSRRLTVGPTIVLPMDFFHQLQLAGLRAVLARRYAERRPPDSSLPSCTGRDPPPPPPPPLPLSFLIIQRSVSRSGGQQALIVRPRAPWAAACSTLPAR